MDARFSYIPICVQNFLLENNIDNIGNHIDIREINQQYSDNKFTVLMVVCRCLTSFMNNPDNFHIPHDTEKVEWLLIQGADPDIQSDDKNTALIFAARYSSERIVEILIKGGANPNVQNIYGYTALMKASLYSSGRGESPEKIVELLIAGGANLDIQSNSKVGGYTALILAAENSSPERGTSSLRTVEILLASGANLDIQTTYGWTALILAARSSHWTSSKRTVDILLTAGANVNLRNAFGWTVAHYLPIDEKTEM